MGAVQKWSGQKQGSQALHSSSTGKGSLCFGSGLKVKKKSAKVGLKLNIQKTKIMASGPITSWQTDGETMKQCQTLFFWAPKSLQMVSAAMKFKDSCSSEEKLWPN